MFPIGGKCVTSFIGLNYCKQNYFNQAKQFL